MVDNYGALILAAGRGSRMGGVTQSQPKCLTLLADQTLLKWQIDALKGAGTNPISAIGGYRYEMLEQFISVSFVNSRWNETGVVRTLSCASDFLCEYPNIVSYSDILYGVDHVARLINSDYDLAITYDTKWLDLWSLRFEDPLSDAETFSESDGWLQEIGDKTSCIDNIKGQFMGLIKFSPIGWGWVKELLADLSPEQVDVLDMTTLLKTLLNKGKKIGAIPVNGGWCEVDNTNDLQVYEQKLGKNKEPGINWSHDWRFHK